jgi:MoaA/NifB/PqqE/SkfB family radical SAM enzyme
MNKRKINHGIILLTTACPIECEHCALRCTSSKEKRKWMPEKIIRRIAEEYSKNDILSVLISGGEPFYDLKKLDSCLNILLNYYKSDKINIATSGFFATNNENTLNILNFVKRRVGALQVSVDRFHMKKVPFSNVERVLKFGKMLEIRIVLRILLDKKSRHLIKPVIKLISKYEPEIAFSITDPSGRAELFDQKLIGYNEVINSFTSKIKNKLNKRKIHFPQSPIRFTIYPNGNVYVCCNSAKLTFIGNINNENLNKMQNRLKRNFLGFIFFNGLDCKFINKLIPSDVSDQCDFCKNQPFIENSNFGVEYQGRKFIKISMKSLDSAEKKYDGIHELLLSFQLNEFDLKKENGIKILKTFEELFDKKIRFKVSRPLPRCLFGQNWNKVVRKFKIPKDCFECRELFSIDRNGITKICPNIYNIKGKDLLNFKGRLDILKYYKKFYEELEISKKCNNCIYFERKLCNALCFRKI